MNKTTLLIVFLFLSFISVNAQNVSIQSVSTIPATLSDTQQVKAVVETQFTSGGCPLINSNYYISNDTVHLMAYYQVGMLAVICNSSDTIDLGILPCEIHTLHVQAFVSGSANTDNYFLPLNISCSPVAIAEPGGANDILVFHDSHEGELNVKIKGEKNSLLKISIFNLLGGQIYSSTDLQTRKEFVKQIDTSAFAKGVYFVRVENSTGSRIKKFAKE